MLPVSPLEVRVGLVQGVPEPVPLQVDGLRGGYPVALADQICGPVVVGPLPYS